MSAQANITIDLSHVQSGLALEIIEKWPGTLFDQELDASAYNEARYQLVEGCYYDYDLNHEDYCLGSVDGNIIQAHRKRPYTGTIAPNIYVGTLFLPLFKTGSQEPVYKIPVEVRSRKSTYREDYQDMLEYIAEKSTDLLLQINSPVYQNFEPDYSRDVPADVLYQRFIFLKSIVGTTEFAEAVHRIVTAPVTTWREESDNKDIRNVRRFSKAAIIELAKGNNRSALTSSHHLYERGLRSLPNKIPSSRKVDSLDTPENRFIKYSLEAFLKFLVDIRTQAEKINEAHVLVKESGTLIYELENHLHHAVFSEISKPSSLQINSPVLQRKEGYREVLRVWLMFDLAAKLIWKGGEDVYQGGKKDIATLYEYWLFFKLLELLQSMFDIQPVEIEKLISKTQNGLNVNLRQGKFTPLKGTYDAGHRKFNVQFNYNRSFRGKNDYPSSGSWTTTLRPDYTLSIWPFGIDELSAEKEELIVHIHFDAKYKVDQFFVLTDQEDETALNEEKRDNRKGIYKNADLLKMHAYKDAIRRTGGAYVLYPGTEQITRLGFHEIIPGLGAFPVKPSKGSEGTEELKAFIKEVVDHFINRSSQREKIALKSYQVYQQKPKEDDRVNDILPETYGINRHLIPDDTYVMVGFYKSPVHLKWIESEKKYNFRTGSGLGSLNLDAKTISAQYLLLHTTGDENSNRIWKISSKGPRVYSRKELDSAKNKYPSDEKSSGDEDKFYLVLDILPVSEQEFLNVSWKFKELNGYRTGHQSAVPFTVTLSELSRVRIW